MIWVERAVGLLVLALVRGALDVRNAWEKWRSGRYAR